MPPIPRRAASQPSSPSGTTGRPWLTRAQEPSAQSTTSTTPRTPITRRRRPASTNSSPYPSTSHAVASARHASRTTDRTRRVLADIDWWTVVSGQQPHHDDEQEDDEQDALADLRGYSYRLPTSEEDEILVEDVSSDSSSQFGDNSSQGSSSAVSEDGSSFSEDGTVADVEAAGDPLSEISEGWRAGGMVDALWSAEQATREPHEFETMQRPPSPFFPTTLPPLSPLLTQEAAEPVRPPRASSTQMSTATPLSAPSFSGSTPTTSTPLAPPPLLLPPRFTGGSTVTWERIRTPAQLCCPPGVGAGAGAGLGIGIRLGSGPGSSVTLGAIYHALGVLPGTVSGRVLREALSSPSPAFASSSPVASSPVFTHDVDETHAKLSLLAGAEQEDGRQGPPFRPFALTKTTSSSVAEFLFAGSPLLVDSTSVLTFR